MIFSPLVDNFAGCAAMKTKSLMVLPGIHFEVSETASDSRSREWPAAQSFPVFKNDTAFTVPKVHFVVALSPDAVIGALLRQYYPQHLH